MEEENWLEMAEAARLLGVHQSTLRRWADSGRIASLRTLNGRRRFSPAVIEQARQAMFSHDHLLPESETFETKSLDLARQRTHNLTAQPDAWMASLNEDQRAFFRYGGQRLLALIMQFIRNPDEMEHLLAEGRQVTNDYGRICFKAGLSVLQTVDAFLYYRRSILESVQETLGSLNIAEKQAIFLRAVDFFDTLLLSTLDSFLRAAQSTETSS